MYTRAPVGEKWVMCSDPRLEKSLVSGLGTDGQCSLAVPQAVSGYIATLGSHRSAAHSSCYQLYSKLEPLFIHADI